MSKIKAVLVEDAECIGSGSDRWKRINGLTKSVISKIEGARQIHGDLEILVYSHTEYLGQKYKLAVNQGDYGWQHRQINDSDYQIVATV